MEDKKEKPKKTTFKETKDSIIYTSRNGTIRFDKNWRRSKR